MKKVFAILLFIWINHAFGMGDTDMPTKIQLPFAANAGSSYKRVIPVASQIGIQNGAASYNDGFPPLNFLPVAAGGVPPFGQDMNGILNAISSLSRWYSAGAPIFYDSTFQTAIGGYPKGSVVQSNITFGQFWISSTDNNITDPDTGGAGWTNLSAVGGVLTGTLPNPSLAVGAAASNIGTLSGALSGTLPSPSIANSVNLPGSPTTTTQSYGDSTTKIATTAFVMGQGIGNSQTWQNMLGSATGCAAARASGVTCTNSTGRPIMVSVGATNIPNYAENITGSVNGTVICENGASYGGTYMGVTFIVPSGATYSITTTQLINVWSELR